MKKTLLLNLCLVFILSCSKINSFSGKYANLGGQYIVNTSKKTLSTQSIYDKEPIVATMDTVEYFDDENVSGILMTKAFKNDPEYDSFYFYLIYSKKQNQYYGFSIPVPLGGLSEQALNIKVAFELAKDGNKFNKI
ncbi:MAG: hypothetical protein ACRCVW_00215 [Brevinema sp.]